MSEENNYYYATITLDTDKPVISVIAHDWEEFREKAGFLYKQQVGKDIDWKKSKFTLQRIHMTSGSRKFDICLDVQIIPFSTSFSSGLIEFDGCIKGKIVEK
jgi:hypothetical protein